jgi:hypothetical protein
MMALAIISMIIGLIFLRCGQHFIGRSSLQWVTTLRTGSRGKFQSEIVTDELPF